MSTTRVGVRDDLDHRGTLDLMRYHRVNAVDAIWLNMDRPQNLMVIECLMFLDGPVDRARFEQVVRTRLLDLYPVFSRRPVPGRRGRGRPAGATPGRST